MAVDRSTLPSLPDRATVVRFCAEHGVDVTERFVKSEQLAGRLASHRVANTTRYAPADVLAWLAAMRRPATAREAQEAAR